MLPLVGPVVFGRSMIKRKQTGPSSPLLETGQLRMHCNLSLPDATPLLIFFNYDALANFEVAQPIDYRLIAFLLLTRYPRCDLDL